MRGVGRASAALTVVNALPTGLGCAVGIARYVTVRALLEPSRTSSLQCRPAESATPVVRASVAAALRRVGTSEPFQTSLELVSEIPVGKGLKSSSAVSTATIAAVARALGHDLDVPSLAGVAAQVGRATGVSATGAYDDALAGLRSGFVMTDNRTDRLLFTEPAEPDWTTVVFLPEGTHPSAPALAAAFQARSADGERAAVSARAGRFAEAMEANSRLVEDIMRYSYAEPRRRLVAGGAVMAGVSGLGPALAAIVSRDRSRSVQRALPGSGWAQFAAPLSSEAPA